MGLLNFIANSATLALILAALLRFARGDSMPANRDDLGELLDALEQAQKNRRDFQP